MVKIKNGNQFDKYIVLQTIECQTENIKFQNITFDCKTITDAKGNVFFVQPERKRGKWIVHMQRGNWSDREQKTCSKCGMTFVDLDVANFCPNCGALMKGEEE